jgi:hypothetical protein
VAADDQEPADPRRRKERPWFLDPRAIVAFLGALVALILGVTQLLKQVKDPPAQVSAEYIVDVSRGMNGRIGPEPKLPATAAEVLSHVETQPSRSTSLRFAGPECRTDYQEPNVGFSEDNSDAFRDALESASPSGRSNFANAVAHAADDFIDRGDAAQSKTKSLFIFVGGNEGCSDAPSAVIGRALRTLANTGGVQLNLKFVGVRVPPEMRTVLRRIRDLVRRLGFTSEIVVADRPSELEGVLPGSDCSAREVQYGDPC